MALEGEGRCKAGLRSGVEVWEAVWVGARATYETKEDARASPALRVTDRLREERRTHWLQLLLVPLLGQDTVQGELETYLHESRVRNISRSQDREIGVFILWSRNY